MHSRLYGIYGASGFGREVMPVARKSCSSAKKNDFFFIDDNTEYSEVNGHKILSFEEFCLMDVGEKFIAIAISDARIRSTLLKKIYDAGISGVSIISPDSVIMDDCILGEHAIISPFVTLTSNIRIGRAFHANIYSYVAHDCQIGDFVTFAPGVKCNGNVHIGDGAYIGTGAIIKQGKPLRPLKIGAGAIVAAGAVVTRNVPDGITVFGNPAKPLTKENLRSHA